MTENKARITLSVMPAKAGIQVWFDERWIPAFAGMTEKGTGFPPPPSRGQAFRGNDRKKR